MEARLFEGNEAHVSTFDFHEHRERAPHLEQAIHRRRLEIAAELVHAATERRLGNLTTRFGRVRVIDLGCGDGGLLQLLKDYDNVDAIGFDFQPSNTAGWAERGVRAYQMDFVNRWNYVPIADVYVMTECLEHLTRPHEIVRQVCNRGAALVASSPWTEHAGSHDECHAWAWDEEGYREMMQSVGFTVLEQMATGMFQVVLCV